MKRFSRLLIYSIGIVGGTLLNVWSTQTLYIYYPTPLKAQSIQDEFITLCPGIECRVYARYKDFMAMVEKEPPTAILAITPLLNRMPSYSQRLHAVRDGMTEEQYVLMSIASPVDIDSISPTMVVGVLECMERDDIDSFVRKMVGVVPQLKRVSKVEDFLPLLAFNMANCVIITKYQSRYIRKISNLSFYTTDLPQSQQGIASLAIRRSVSGSEKIVESVQKANKILGIDTWMVNTTVQ